MALTWERLPWPRGLAPKTTWITLDHLYAPLDHQASGPLAHAPRSFALTVRARVGYPRPLFP